MTKLHEKSPCCRGKIWRLNGRRRQCSICGKTWRVWKRKRGRKKQRVCFNLLLSYLTNESGAMSKQALKKHITPAGLQARMAQTVQAYNKENSWPNPPDGELIAVADAMIEYIRGMPHTIYFILLRAINSNKAVIMPFFVTIGIGEGSYGWNLAIQGIPAEVRTRIRVMVCDGVQALGAIAREEGWILQRCHFHLRARLFSFCSPRRFSKKPELGRHIQKLVEIVLSGRNEENIQKAIEELAMIKNEVSARSFRTVLSGLTKHYADYRAYLRYPQYHIPCTSNSAEFMIGQIRGLQYRARGFNSLKSLSSWIEAYCKFTKTITCNGKISIPN